MLSGVAQGVQEMGVHLHPMNFTFLQDKKTILCIFHCGTPKVHPFTQRAYAAPGICWEEGRQEMGCGKRRYFAQVLIAGLAAIFDDSICESLMPHFSEAFF